MINENINYRDLSSYVSLAIEEFEFYNKTNVVGYSFEDLISWLDDFGNCDANSRQIKRIRKPKEPELKFVPRGMF